MAPDPRELQAEAAEEPLLPAGGGDAGPRAARHRRREQQDLDPSASIVQFSSPIFYGDVAEEEMRLDIVRIDNYKTCVSVKFFTEDVSAKAGEVYKATSGEVIFGQGDFQKTVSIPFIRTGVWSATTELKVRLTDAKGCKLGAYLHTCRVKVVDENVFPSSKLREQLQQGPAKKIPPFSLYWHYFKWNALSAKLIWPSLLTLVMDQLKNIYALLMINCDMYLVNVVCNLKAPDDELILPSRELCAYMIAALHIVPLALLYVWDNIKIRLDIEGKTAIHLQKHMYRKYMNFSSDVLNELGPETLQWCLLTEAPKLAGGYVAGLTILQVLVSVVMQIYFVGMKKPAALPVILMVPAAILAWGSFRNLKFRFPGLRVHITKLTAYVQETSTKHGLIQAYAIRPQMNADFIAAAEVVQATGVKRGLHKLHTNTVLNWIAPSFICLYIMFTIHEVLNEQIKLGTFLGIIHIIKNVATQTLKAYDTTMDIVTIFGALFHVTDFLNKETEVRVCKAVNRQRRSTSASILKAARGKFPDFDALPIFCRNVRYTADDADLLENLNIRTLQGKIVAVCGPAKSGKNSFLRMLSNQIFPSEGEVFVPSHLRVLFVGLAKQFFDRSLLHNLTLGCPHFNANDVPRLKSILKDLGLQHLTKQVDEELQEDHTKPEDGQWLRRLAQTDQYKLDLARAFLMNPEVLLLAKPFGMSKSVTQQVQGLLREHVRNRGLHQPPSAVAHRRPRTVVFSCDDAQDCDWADVVWIIGQTGRRNSQGQDVFTMIEESGGLQEADAPVPVADKKRRSPHHWLTPLPPRRESAEAAPPALEDDAPEAPLQQQQEEPPQQEEGGTLYSRVSCF